MGCIRVLLATSVILGHLTGWWGLENHYSGNLHHYFMVQIFFVISGFYIALVLTEKYRNLSGGTKAFYVNRYLRLMPAFLFISALTLVVILWDPTALPQGRSITAGYNWPESMYDWYKLFLVACSNLTLFGSDLIAFFHINNEPAENFILVPQSWSLGCELWFYLLSPFMVILPNLFLVVICIASFALRFVIDYLQLPFFPWQQSVFWTEIMFFIFGIFAYRLYKHFVVQDRKYTKIAGHLLAIAFAAVILAASHLVPQLNALSAHNSLIIGLYAMLVIPFIFSISRFSKFDRILGEISYLMYLWHILLGFLLQPYLHYWHGFFLPVMSFLFSIPVLIAIEIPMERYRNSLFKKPKSIQVMAT